MLRKIDEKYIKWGLSIISWKTEYVVVRSGGSYLQLTDIQIENIDNYKYIDVSITNGGQNTIETATRIRQDNSAIRELNHVIRNTKIGTYKSIATVASGIWVIIWKGASKLKAMEMILPTDQKRHTKEYWNQSAYGHRHWHPEKYRMQKEKKMGEWSTMAKANTTVGPTNRRKRGRTRKS